MKTTGELTIDVTCSHLKNKLREIDQRFYSQSGDNRLTIIKKAFNRIVFRAKYKKLMMECCDLHLSASTGSNKSSGKKMSERSAFQYSEIVNFVVDTESENGKPAYAVQQMDIDMLTDLKEHKFLDKYGDECFLGSESEVMKEIISAVKIIKSNAEAAALSNLRNTEYANTTESDKAKRGFLTFCDHLKIDYDSADKPRFIKELGSYSQDFIGYLKYLGAFEFTKGGGGHIDFDSLYRSMEDHGFFYYGLVSSGVVKPDFYKKIKNPKQIEEYKSWGQMADSWQVVEDAKLMKP